MTTSKKAGLATLFCLALSGCGGGGGDTSTVVKPDSDVKGVFDDYSGNLDYEGQGGDGDGVGGGGDGDGGVGAGGSLGQFRGVEAVVYLEDGTELGRTIVNSANGLFTIKPGKTYQGALLLELRGRSGAQYYDEAKTTFIDFGPGLVLKARADRANRNIGITPLTNAAAAYMDANPGAGGATIAEQIRSANQLVGAALTARLPAEYAVGDVLLLPTIIGPASGQGSAPDTPAGSYAVVLASLAEAAASFNPALSKPALSINESLAKDFTDGKIDDQQKNGDPIAPVGQESYSEAEFDGQLNSAISKSESQLGEPNNTRDTNKTIALLDQDLVSISPVVDVFDDPNISGSGRLTSSGSAVSQVAGGNPGAHVSTDMNLFGGDLIAVGAIKANYTYTPSIEGPIASVTGKADVQMISSGDSSWFLVVEQGSIRYYAKTGADFSGNWSPVSLNGLAAADFETFGTLNIANPDFSGSGGPIKFGFVIANVIAGNDIVNGSGPFTLSHQVDNLELTITKP